MSNETSEEYNRDWSPEIKGSIMDFCQFPAKIDTKTDEQSLSLQRKRILTYLYVIYDL